MRRLLVLIFFGCLLVAALPVAGADGKVIKVLPFFLDLQNRHTIYPSLYERDAYQNFLRQNPQMRSGMMFQVQWKVYGTPRAPLRLRLELRGTAEGNLPREMLIEKAVWYRGVFSRTSNLLLSGEEYAELREVTAWRVTLWEGDDLLIGQQQSFLW